MLVYVSKVILRCKVMGLTMISNKMNRAQKNSVELSRYLKIENRMVLYSP